MRLLSPCRKYREDLCAVMSGDVGAEDHARLEEHLEACVACQRYRDEIGSVAAFLASGKDLVAEVEPHETSRTRWNRDFDAAIEPAHSIAIKVSRGLLDWSRDMVWPCRRTWAGMAVLWMLILCLNSWPKAQEEAQASQRPAPQILRALLAREGFLAGPGHATEGGEPEPPHQAPPQTRNERRTVL